MAEQESWGGRLGRFAALVGIVLAITVGVVVTQRLSDDALALLVGLTCGMATMLPVLGLGVWLWRRQEAEQRQREAQRHQAPAAPPVIVVAPAAFPGSHQPWAALSAPPTPWDAAPAERRFTIVGEE